MTNFLAFTANPDPESLTQTIGKAFLEGAKAKDPSAGTEFVDLHAIGFDPTYRMADRKQYLNEAPMPDDAAALQRKILDADVIALVFPVYWCSMPAMMKGFTERVLCRHFGYNPDKSKSAIADKKFRVIMLTGSSEKWYRDSGIDFAIRHQVIYYMFHHYCGVDDAELVYVDNLEMGDNSPEARAAASKHIERIKELGASLA
ncbi:NAD(P)H-dependent oxidoreductase [Bifidobacterium sp. ESL0704]|uniref:NAD(P)H-dependent oxidoreductase n=1 Tax=Bifidobacterium sp. ESL0704 TaxID=2983219 RepID=UPI0023F94C83|nr:NAD(P)H-dependent oxidoreductase [Bifidobacterium sp. ESL0704]WEV52524.1 NAD(P)H-dependent oxidoreductase [Bifidobacterium sp. ESL0704]